MSFGTSLCVLTGPADAYELHSFSLFKSQSKKALLKRYAYNTYKNIRIKCDLALIFLLYPCGCESTCHSTSGADLDYIWYEIMLNTRMPLL